MCSNMKNLSKSDVFVYPIRYLISSCARQTELSVMAPLKHPSNNWRRILHMTPMIQTIFYEFIQVSR